MYNPDPLNIEQKKEILKKILESDCIERGMKYDILFHNFIQNKECGLRKYIIDSMDDQFMENPNFTFNTFESTHETIYFEFLDLLRHESDIIVEGEGQFALLRGITFRCLNAE